MRKRAFWIIATVRGSGWESAMENGSKRMWFPFLPKGFRWTFAKRGFVDLNNRPASLNNGWTGQSSMPACGLALAYNTFFPISFSAAGANLYSWKNHCAVDEDYFDYLQRKADLQNKTGKKLLLDLCSDKTSAPRFKNAGGGFMDYR